MGGGEKAVGGEWDVDGESITRQLCEIHVTKRFMNCQQQIVVIKAAYFFKHSHDRQ